MSFSPKLISFLFFLFTFIPCSHAKSSPSQVEAAIAETLLWIKEHERYIPVTCRQANAHDVRENKIAELSDVILNGKIGQDKTNSELNVGYYVRLRLQESASDTLASRLGRLRLSLLDVPTSSCELWEKVIKKNNRK